MKSAVAPERAGAGPSARSSQGLTITSQELKASQSTMGRFIFAPGKQFTIV